MIKIIMSMLLLLNLNLFASLVEDGLTAYIQGDVKLANELYLKACKKGSTKGCLKSGLLYYTGTKGVKKNVIKAKKLFVKACKQSNPEACYYVGVIYKRGEGGIERNYKKATTYFAAGCKMRLPKSCKQYDLIRHKRQVVGAGNNDHNFSYTYTTEVYGG
jgi:TPR repeat protein